MDLTPYGGLATGYCSPTAPLNSRDGSNRRPVRGLARLHYVYDAWSETTIQYLRRRITDEDAELVSSLNAVILRCGDAGEVEGITGGNMPRLDDNETETYPRTWCFCCSIPFVRRVKEGGIEERYKEGGWVILTRPPCVD
ncbi:MAG: hypothetical protein JW846_07625 [Dehalococcoidia bacterium]|nr:hypothetical protein [Dehalococcoidia bacterium]